MYERKTGYVGAGKDVEFKAEMVVDISENEEVEKKRKNRSGRSRRRQKQSGT